MVLISCKRVNDFPSQSAITIYFATLSFLSVNVITPNQFKYLKVETFAKTHKKSQEFYFYEIYPLPCQVSYGQMLP